ncbi:MAG: hypothetical protein JXP34_00915 [Planctomycetes bacterium]|nr:hypothetical protein [Planctomycetota bacterium]
MRRCCPWVLEGALCALGSISWGWFEPAEPNEIEFPAVQARFVRLAILESEGGQPCIDELEIYGPAGGVNLALASAGAKASASSLLPGYAIHQVAHLNDGLYGNGHSWIAAGTRDEWAQIELAQVSEVAMVVFSRDREGRYADRLPAGVEVRVSIDGATWTTVAREGGAIPLPEAFGGEEDLLRYAFACEERTWRKVDKADPLRRILGQLDEMVERFGAKGLDVTEERTRLEELRRRERDLEGRAARTAAGRDAAFQARLLKRRLFLRDPDLAGLERILFVKRQPYEPSHNYSDLFDPTGKPGGAICLLEIPHRDGRLDPAAARLVTLYDAGAGVARDPAASFDAERIYFSWRPSLDEYFHIFVMDADGGGLRQLTDGPFHDVFPCPLPDGGLAFMSTRCRARFLCWRPQAFVLFRMDAEGGDIRPLSHANLSEWTPAVMRDGRILWMRSEYLDKGADFGHTLWAIRPDGTHPDLVFGNDTRNCYANGREIPGTDEILCTLVSHGGDLNGPLAVLDPALGKFNPLAITNITPDVAPHYHMSWARNRCFRDPYPLGRDVYLASHAPNDRFGLYLVDRFGNREVLYLDPRIGSMAPTPFRPEAPPPRIAESQHPGRDGSAEGHFVLLDVYRGLEPQVPRGRVKYIRVCQEVRAKLLRLPGGEYQKDHEPFEDWYATPTHKVRGPNGWPSYVAKADLGIAPVEEDGSANFLAPAGKVLYFEALDAEFNEIQRMRSVLQLQPGETRSCIGCHENRSQMPAAGRVMPLALRRAPSALEPPPWGAVPFSYEEVVQPVLDRRCARCHDAADPREIDLTGRLDPDGVPASFRTLIEQGWVHYFDFAWGQEHHKASPLSFGTVKSKLWQVLGAGHEDIRLTPEETYRVKCWIDLNCPLWPDYIYRPNRLAVRP